MANSKTLGLASRATGLAGRTAPTLHPAAPLAAALSAGARTSMLFAASSVRVQAPLSIAPARGKSTATGSGIAPSDVERYLFTRRSSVIFENSNDGEVKLSPVKGISKQDAQRILNTPNPYLAERAMTTNLAPSAQSKPTETRESKEEPSDFEKYHALHWNRELSDKLMLSKYEEAAGRITPPPADKPENPHFGVGPVMAHNAGTEKQKEDREVKYNDFVKKTYGVSVLRQEQSMHRTPEGLKATHDLLETFHKFIGSPAKTRVGIVSGSGYGGFAALSQNILNPHEKIYIDTVDPRTVKAGDVGFFRHRWARDLLSRYEKAGLAHNIIFAQKSGTIPSAKFLKDNNVKFFMGVGNETTGGTSYSDVDIANLREWVALNPAGHHAAVDLTSWSGERNLPPEILRDINFFIPLQKAAGGAPGVSVLGIRPETAKHIETVYAKQPWSRDAVFDIAPEVSGGRSIDAGPFYNPETGKTGPVINTKDIVRLMKSTFAMREIMGSIGDANAIAARSQENLAELTALISKSDILTFADGGKDVTRRSAAVALFTVKRDYSLNEEEHTRLIALMKEYTGFRGITRPNGEKIPGLDAANDLNTYPGTPGDIRCWIGGVRPKGDMAKLVANLEHAYYVAKAVVLEEILAKQGIIIKTPLVPISKAAGKIAAGVAAAATAATLAKLTPEAMAREPINITLIVADQFLYSTPQQVEAAISEHKKNLAKQGIVFIDGRNGEVDYAALPVGKPGEPTKYEVYNPGLRNDQITAEYKKIIPYCKFPAIVAAAELIPAEAQFAINKRQGNGTNNFAKDQIAKDGHIIQNIPGANTIVTSDNATNAVAGHPRIKWFAQMAMEGKASANNLQPLFGESPPVDKEALNKKVRGKTVAILGTGDIGTQTMFRMLESDAARVQVYSRSLVGKYNHAEILRLQQKFPKLVICDSIDRAMTGANVTINHMALVTGPGGTENIIGTKQINLMAKEGREIIDAARPGIFVPEALIQAHKDGARVVVDFDTPDKDPSNKAISTLWDYAKSAYGKPGPEFLYSPHAFADTCPKTRCAMDALAREGINLTRQGKVHNFAGNGKIPEGFENLGKVTPEGIVSLGTYLDDCLKSAKNAAVGQKDREFEAKAR